MERDGGMDGQRDGWRWSCHSPCPFVAASIPSQQLLGEAAGAQMRPVRVCVCVCVVGGDDGGGGVFPRGCSPRSSPRAQPPAGRGEPEPKLFASFLETAQWRARRRIRGQG